MNLLDREQEFRAAMRRLASTVSVITCADHNDWFGMTATAVTSVCTEPATLLVCVNRNASLHQPLHAGGRFCINILQTTQIKVAQAFSGQLRGRARFGVGHWTLHEGVPVLQDAQASLCCTLVQTLDHGSHSIFLGRVGSVAVADAVAPLIYQDGAYTHASALAEFATV